MLLKSGSKEPKSAASSAHLCVRLLRVDRYGSDRLIQAGGTVIFTRETAALGLRIRDSVTRNLASYRKIRVRETNTGGAITHVNSESPHLQSYEFKAESGKIRCPVCSAASLFTEVAIGWGEWRTCSQCGLEFVNPLRLPDRPEALFDNAYRGNVRESAFQDFSRNLERRRAMIKDPSLWFWTPAYQEILAWLKGRVMPGGTVFELGCGHGLYLHSLRKEGFVAVGLDPAQAVVELNQGDGFKVWHGTIESVPAEWVTPDAIVALFIMHHLEDPRGALASVRRRWPTTPIAIAQYGPGRRAKDRSDPPRNLTRWNSRSLAALLHEAGYSVSVSNVHGAGTSREFLRPFQAALKSMTAIPPFYRLLKRIQRDRLPRVMYRPGSEAEVVLGFGIPIDENASN